jgi:mRNA-degrading endonuclease RelE of RelBE toxin-antitoxin system
VNYEVFTIPVFDKAVKRLSKKYRSIKVDLERLVKALEANPFAGHSGLQPPDLEDTSGQY